MMVRGAFGNYAETYIVNVKLVTIMVDTWALKGLQHPLVSGLCRYFYESYWDLSGCEECSWILGFLKGPRTVLVPNAFT